MQMMVIIYNKILEERVLSVLQEHGVTSFTETPRVLGAGEAGIVEDTRHHPGYNGCIFAAMPDEKTIPVSRGLAAFAEEYRSKYGRHPGLRAFSLACEQIV